MNISTHYDLCELTYPIEVLPVITLQHWYFTDLRTLSILPAAFLLSAKSKAESRFLLKRILPKYSAFRFRPPHEGAGTGKINGSVPIRIDTDPCFYPESDFTALCPARSLADRAARSR